MNRPLIKEPWKQQAQQIDRDGSDGGFRRQILSIQVIDSPKTSVGNNELISELRNRRVHAPDYPAGKSERQETLQAAEFPARRRLFVTQVCKASRFAGFLACELFERRNAVGTDDSVVPSGLVQFTVCSRR
jgi:hypothetical protein